MSERKKSTKKKLEDVTVVTKSKFNDVTGFDPKTPLVDIVKHYSKIIAKKKLNDIIPNLNYVIAIKVPVWPIRVEGIDIKYYKDLKTGKWKYSHFSGLLLKADDNLAYNNIPISDKFRADDFEDHPFQFLVVASDSEYIKPGRIAHTRPEVKSIGFFNYKGEELVMLTNNSVMFTVEV